MAIKLFLPPPEDYTPPCAGNPDWYHINNMGTARKLAAICRRQCECITQCAAEADVVRADTIGHNLWGVWGGRVYQMENKASA